MYRPVDIDFEGLPPNRRDRFFETQAKLAAVGIKHGVEVVLRPPEDLKVNMFNTALIYAAIRYGRRHPTAPQVKAALDSSMLDAKRSRGRAFAPETIASRSNSGYVLGLKATGHTSAEYAAGMEAIMQASGAGLRLHHRQLLLATIEVGETLPGPVLDDFVGAMSGIEGTNVPLLPLVEVPEAPRA